MKFKSFTRRKLSRVGFSSEEMERLLQSEIQNFAAGKEDCAAYDHDDNLPTFIPSIPSSYLSSFKHAPPSDLEYIPEGDDDMTTSSSTLMTKGYYTS